MKNFIYKHILIPKHERNEPTQTDTVITCGMTAITVIIVFMIIGHYATEMFKFDRMSRITDTCRIEYVIADFNEPNEFLCESYLHDNEYYKINQNKTNTNLYLHRRLNINDNGKMNDAMYENPLKYTAQ